MALYRTLRSIWASYKYNEVPNKIVDYFQRVGASFSDVVFGFFVASNLLLIRPLREANGSYLIIIALLIFLFALQLIRKGWQRSAKHAPAGPERS